MDLITTNTIMYNNIFNNNDNNNFNTIINNNIKHDKIKQQIYRKNTNISHNNYQLCQNCNNTKYNKEYYDFICTNCLSKCKCIGCTNKYNNYCILILICECNTCLSHKQKFLLNFK